MISWYAGVDAGGSKTTAVAMSAAGNVVGRGRAASGSLTAERPEAVAAAISLAIGRAAMEAGIDAAATPPRAATIGLAGFSNESRRNELGVRLSSASPETRWRIAPDYVTAWYGASGGRPGVCVIAGTGSVSYGRNGSGSELRLDGLGYLLGDTGGGVRLVLDAILNNFDLPAGESPTALGRAMMSEAGVDSASAIIPWIYTDFSPARVAALAPTIGAWADAGDRHAARAIRAHALRLRRLALETLHGLHLPLHAPVYPAGGLWACSQHLRETFAHGVGAVRVPSPERHGASEELLTVLQPITDAAEGAANMSRGLETA